MVNSKEESALRTAVMEAGKRLLHYWPGVAAQGTNLGITKKPDGSYVTRADYESNEILIAALRGLFPNDEIFSEEVNAAEIVSGAERAWIIDPLDGTQSFIDGRDDFSILVGLAVRDIIDYGIMYFPVRGLFALGRRGRGAQLNGLRMAVSQATTFRKHSIYLRHVAPRQESFVYPEWLDSGLAFLQLCRGELDGIVIKLGRHQEWDLAAPSVMIEESGGMVTDEKGDPIRFYRAPIKYKYLVASNGVVHEQLLNLVASF